jgi:hypothetical protein
MGFSLLIVMWALALPVRPLHGGQGFLQDLTAVPGRIVVEPTLPSPFPEEIKLVFADAYGRAVADITLSANKATSFSFVRGGVSGEGRISTDGTFNLLLPRGEYRLILTHRPNPLAVQSSSLADFSVKSAQSGTTNLLEKPLVVKETFDGEIVIVLAKCPSEGCR